MSKRPNQRNAIEYEDFDQAVKAAYSLGQFDGQVEIRTQLDDLRKQLADMLKTNRHLFDLMHTEESNAVRMRPVLIRHIISVLGRSKKEGGQERRNLLDYLKRKYKEQNEEAESRKVKDGEAKTRTRNNS